MKFLACFQGILGMAMPAFADDRSIAAKKSAGGQHSTESDDWQALQTHFRDSVQRGDLPGGSVLLVRNGKETLREGFGFGHLRRKDPFTADLPFRVASLSKSIIATLIVKLAAQKQLSLDQPISVYLPEAAKLKLADGQSPNAIPTLRQCLKHTAGFIGDEDEDGRPWLSYRGKGLSLADVVADEIKMPMQRNPGTRFRYSGIGYDMAGHVVEIVTGQSLDEALQSELCRPLGMSQTTYYPNSATRDRMPSFYWRWRSDGSLHRKLTLNPVPRGDYCSVGGGIVSTLDDLKRFLTMHLNEGKYQDTQVIPKEAIRSMYEIKRPGTFYGLGFTLGPADQDGLGKSISHTGSSGTIFWVDRERSNLGLLITQHRFSNGKKMPEADKKHAKNEISWTRQTKTQFIDPILGWTNRP